MTNLTLPQPYAEPMQRCLVDLLAQMTAAYQQTKAERQVLSAALLDSEDEFTVLEELELVTTDLRGYAGQVLAWGRIEDERTATAHLQRLRLLSIPSVAAFYCELGDDYPLLKDYVRQLDYLRLLLLEFLQAARA